MSYNFHRLLDSRVDQEFKSQAPVIRFDRGHL